MKNNITITGERLKECRVAAGYKKQEDIARILNVQRQIISYYETGERKPDIDNLVKLAKLYNTSTDYLLGLSDVATKNEDVQYICEFTGLSADSVNNLLDINYEKKDYKDSIFEADKDTYKLKQATLFFINCVLEDRAALNAMSINFYEYFKLLSDKNYDANTYSLEVLFAEFQAEQQNNNNNMCIVPKSEMIDYRFYSFINRFSETLKYRAEQKSLFFEE